MSVPVPMSGPDIETLLAAHYDPATCVREHGMRGDVPMVAAHCAHVAAVLRAHIVTAQADAWDDGYETGYDDAIWPLH